MQQYILERGLPDILLVPGVSAAKRYNTAKKYQRLIDEKMGEGEMLKIDQNRRIMRIFEEADKQEEEEEIKETNETDKTLKKEQKPLD